MGTQSPGKGSNLEDCKTSCQNNADCKSITLFKSGWCSHYSTPCTNTKKKGKAVIAMRLVTPVPEFWEIVSGSEYCQISNDGLCITDGVGGYGHNENCEIRTLRPLIATATQYHAENNYDFLTVAGVEYRGEDGPHEVQLGQGAQLVWKSDHSVSQDGFTVCATTVPVRRHLSVKENEKLKNTGTIRSMSRLRGSRQPSNQQPTN